MGTVRPLILLRNAYVVGHSFPGKKCSPLTSPFFFFRFSFYIIPIITLPLRINLNPREGSNLSLPLSLLLNSLDSFLSDISGRNGNTPTIVCFKICIPNLASGSHILPCAQMTFSNGKVESLNSCNGGDSEKPFRIFVGYDPREDIAYEVCRHSVLKRSSIPVEFIPIKQSDLRKNGLYWRERGQFESTEFSFSRFLTPCLANYKGWAMFVDCDFLYLADIKELRDLIDDKYAIMCVQHDYAPKETTKMDGAVQTVYPRKNWSSMVLYNCGHPKNSVLTPETVNKESGAFLHRFQWLEDHEIGSIPFVWNFLEGHNKVVQDDPTTFPKAIHYTRGGPWFEAWKNCDFADLWLNEKEEYLKEHKKETASRLIEVAHTTTV